MYCRTPRVDRSRATGEMVACLKLTLLNRNVQRVGFAGLCIVNIIVIWIIFSTHANHAKPSLHEAHVKQLACEDYIQRFRSDTKRKLSNYNFSDTGVQKLEQLMMESGGTPLRALIVSSWRSGSSFFSDILHAIPGDLLYFEPFFSYDSSMIRESDDEKLALDTMKSLMNCDFDNYNIRHYHFDKVILERNKELWKHCKTDLYTNKTLLTYLCKMSPFQTTKVVRLRLRMMATLLEDVKVNMKVVFLVRDPRGVMESRLHSHFCALSVDCRLPEYLCADMISDYVAARKLMKYYPERFMIIRYEDLIQDLFNSVEKIYKFLGRSMTSEVETFLHNHTNVNDEARIYSTYRISKNIPFKWKTQLDYDYLQEIQLVCKHAMELWGYRLVRDKSDLYSGYFDPLQPYSLA